METFIAVPPERCFDLARDITLHCRTAAWTHERAIAGVTSGPIGLGESVTFEALHLGVRRRHTSKVVAFERPHLFMDETQSGAFEHMRHTHEFEPVPGGTLMRDTIEWSSPMGPLGRLADALIVERHLARFVARRNLALKRFAESTN